MRRPFWAARFADAATNAPGWNHTMTGAAAGIGSGVQMIIRRQSSLPSVVALPGGLTSEQFDGGTVAFSVAGVQGVAGCGGRQRSGPTGGDAKGTPRNAHEVPLSRPCTSPFAV